MYQWVNPETGKVQLAGQPPAWYRGQQTGPRTFVFDNGRLVDDTGIAVGEPQRIMLRSEAFGEGAGAEIPDEADTKKAELKDALEQAREAGIDIEAVTAEFNAEQEALAEQAAAQSVAARAESLRALIDAFDRERLDQARALLDLIPTNNQPEP